MRPPRPRPVHRPRPPPDGGRRRRWSRRAGDPRPKARPAVTVGGEQGSRKAKRPLGRRLGRDFRYGPISAPMTASTEPPVPSVSSSTRPNTSAAVILAAPGRVRPGESAVGHSELPLWRHPRCIATPSSSPSLRVRQSGSGRMPRESLDAPENLPEEAPGQVALGQLEDEVSGVPNEAPAGLEQPLLETRQRPALDSERQNEPAQEVAEVVGDDRQE